MIPTHLQRYDWYPGHLAHVATLGFTPRHAPPEGTGPDRAVLRGAYLRDADLRDAYLRDAVLTGADLRDADLRGATGITSAGPVGREGRIVYAVDHGDRVMVQCGCWWGDSDATIARIQQEYAGDRRMESYVGAVRSMVAVLVAARTETGVDDG